MDEKELNEHEALEKGSGISPSGAPEKVSRAEMLDGGLDFVKAYQWWWDTETVKKTGNPVNPSDGDNPAPPDTASPVPSTLSRP